MLSGTKDPRGRRRTATKSPGPNRTPRLLGKTWGYDHVDFVLSDTDRVCDWSGVPDGGSLAMPACTAGTCPGHRAGDVLPFQSLFGAPPSDDGGGRTSNESASGVREWYTNQEF